MKEVTGRGSPSSPSSSPFSPTPRKTRRPHSPAFSFPLQCSELYRRARSFSSSSSSGNATAASSSSSFSSTPSVNQSPPFSPPPSYTIPFSWEKRPGIPKTAEPKSTQGTTVSTVLLPLPPPPLRSNSGGFFSIPRMKKKRSGLDDPFALALMECSKEEENRWNAQATAKLVGREPSRRSGSDRFGLRSADFYGSCKATCSVVDSAVYVSPARPSSTWLRRAPHEPPARLITNKQYRKFTYA